MMKKEIIILGIGITLLLALFSGCIEDSKRQALGLVTHGWLFETDVNGEDQFFFVNLPNEDLGYLVTIPAGEEAIWDEDKILELVGVQIVLGLPYPTPDEVVNMAEEKLAECYNATIVPPSEIPEGVDPDEYYNTTDDGNLTIPYACAENCTISQYIPSFVENSLNAWYVITKCDNGIYGGIRLQVNSIDGSVFEPGLPCTICGVEYTGHWNKWQEFVESEDTCRQLLQDYLDENSINGVIQEGYFTQYPV